MGTLQNELRGFSMIRTYDSGSLPFTEGFNEKKFLEGASLFSSNPFHDSAQYFEKIIAEVFIDKVKAGIDIPNYPQFRDVNQMFLDLIDGAEKVKGGHIQTDILSIKKEKTITPEVSAIKRNSQEISETIGSPFKIRICVVGPHTLSSFFIYRHNEIFSQLADIIAQMVENNIFTEKHASVNMVSVEEPLIGILDDPLISYCSEGREKLLKAWESVLSKAKAKGAQTTLHLHKTSDELFWQIKSLDIIEAPVDDAIYKMKKTKQLLDSTDKSLMASICINDFDKLIKQKIQEIQERTNAFTIGEQTAEAWKNIKSGKLQPETFLESVDLMKNRLFKIVERFGAEKVPYAGPECGLKGFPTYSCAIKCLKRISEAAKSIQ
jgi:5-methyltetrahydropteroyltriglutamate--homocysteine methyltransferase